MNSIRPYNRLHGFFLSACLIALLAPTLASAAEEDISQNDPARWYQGADTPKLHYQNLLKEAQAAHAQALQECRSLHGTAAQACRKEARANLTADKARAKRILDQLNSR